MLGRIGKLLKGDYPLAFIVYKMFTKDRIISDHFPVKLYRALSSKKYNRVGDYKIVKLKTYDGLGQAVHPSAVKFNDKIILAVTPFPYGNDYYENPCLYKSADGYNFEPINDAKPIVLPQAHDKLIYLSDPFLFVNDGNLYLIYRECVYQDNENYVAHIYEMHTGDLTNWSTPVELFKSEYGAMSPAVLNENGTAYIYYVKFHNKTTILCRRPYDGNTEEELLVYNTPDEMMLWHIDFFKYNKEIFGLFTFSLDNKGDGAKTYLAYRESELQWRIKQEITLTNKKGVIKKTYKSCSLSVENRQILFVSVRRKDRKWSIYSKDLTIDEENELNV